MRTLSRWLAFLACGGMLIGPAARFSEADPPAGASITPSAEKAAEHLDLAFIPAEAVAAIVVHPQGVLTGPDAEWLPVEVITAQGIKEFGVDPLKIREAVVLFASPTHGTEPDVAAIIYFSEPYSSTAVTSKLPPDLGNTIDGKTVLALLTPRPAWLHMPDDKTIVVGTAPLMQKMLTAKDADSPLIGLLKKVDVSSHLTAVFSIDAVRPLMKQATAAAPSVPPPFQDFLKLPDLLSAILVKVNVGERFKASLTLRGRDDAAAEEVEKLVNQGLAIGRQAVMAQIATMPRGQNDPVQEAGMKYMTRITDKMFGSVKLVHKGQNVSISVETESSFATIGVLAGMFLTGVRESRSAAVEEARLTDEREMVRAREARLAAERNPTTNKMRQIGLALHNYLSEHRTFPARAIFDKQGKPLLSWRVQILPMLEQNNLFQQFHLDEPWDSEHNKPLVAKMPAVFHDPRRPHDGTTTFLAVVGKGLAFEGDKPIKITDFFDGTSDTVLLVQANDERAVPWTKPDDLEVGLAKPKAGLGDAEPNGFAALFADGSVRTISKSIDAKVLKALFTRAGGEAINFEDLNR
jgi:Protein of unknown function (DUF1559)